MDTGKIPPDVVVRYGDGSHKFPLAFYPLSGKARREGLDMNGNGLSFKLSPFKKRSEKRRNHALIEKGGYFPMERETQQSPGQLAVEMRMQKLIPRILQALPA